MDNIWSRAVLKYQVRPEANLNATFGLLEDKIHSPVKFKLMGTFFVAALFTRGTANSDGRLPVLMGCLDFYNSVKVIFPVNKHSAATNQAHIINPWKKSSLPVIAINLQIIQVNHNLSISRGICEVFRSKNRSYCRVHKSFLLELYFVAEGQLYVKNFTRYL